MKGDWLLVYRIDGGGLTLVLTRTSTHGVLSPYDRLGLQMRLQLR